VLVGAYLLAWIDQPDSADERAIIATSASLVQHGRVDMNAVGASDWLLLPLSRIGSIGVDGALYAKKGPTPALFLTPLVLAGQILPWLTIRATAMLFNLIITTGTALLLYTFGRRLGYRPRSALTAGLLYGLCTLAFVYVKTAFGEPLVGLLLLCAVFAAWRSGQAEARHPVGWLALCGTLLTLIVGANVVYLAIVPIVFLFAIPSVFANKSSATRKLIAFGAPLMMGGLLLLAFNALRFGSPFQSGYQFELGEGFTHPFLRGVYGLLIGPQRGFFWYSPVLLLAIPGFLLFLRHERRLGWLVLALIGVQVIVFASWWSWHGGIVWGPRFLLPAIPLSTLFLLPLIESAVKKPLLGLILIAFSLLSFGVQLLGVLYSYFPYIGFLFRQFAPFALNGVMADQFFFDARYSPIIGHLALLTIGYPTQPVWLAHGLDLVYPLLALLLFTLGGAFALGKGPGCTGRREWSLTCAVILVAFNIAIARQADTPQRQSVRALDTALNPPGTVVAATLLFDDALVDVRNGSRVISMNAPTTANDPRALRLWDYALRQGRLLWFVNWFAPGQAENWQERQLWEAHYFALERDAAQHRVLLFNLASDDGTLLDGGWQYANGIRLARYAAWATKDGVYARLEWETDVTLNKDYSWFVHLLDANGNVVQQQDRVPLGGYAPTSSWLPGVRYTDRLFFLASTGNFAGWKLRIGYVGDGKPLTVTDSSGAPLTTPFVLVRIPGP
jgi:hypothetical protein